MKKSILILITLLLFPVSVAAKANLNLSCDTYDLSEEKSTNCKITCTSDEKVGTVRAKIEVSNGLKVSDITKDDNWSGNAEDNAFMLISNDKSPGTKDVVTFSIEAEDKISKNSSIKLVEGVYSDSNYQEHDFAVVTKKIVGNEDGLSSATSTLLPIGIAIGAVVVGAIIIVATKKKK